MAHKGARLLALLFARPFGGSPPPLIAAPRLGGIIPKMQFQSHCEAGYRGKGASEVGGYE